MLTHAISKEFLLWSELIAVWAVASYGVLADPLEDGKDEFQSLRWRLTLIARCVLIAIIFALKSHSLILIVWMVGVCVAHPLARYRISLKHLAEFECVAITVAVAVTWTLIKHLHLTSCWTVVQLPMTAEHISALAVSAATFLVVERGGTYIVKGCLKKADTLPRLPAVAVAGASAVADLHPSADARTVETSKTLASTANANGQEVDVAEINRGRLIGNLERLVLALIVAAGSYSALGFLIAAKGLIRSEEFQDRDFTEYFLVGSLSSVLVALCAGLILRFVLISLWPDLLTLNMQS